MVGPAESKEPTPMWRRRTCGGAGCFGHVSFPKARLRGWRMQAAPARSRRSSPVTLRERRRMPQVPGAGGAECAEGA